MQRGRGPEISPRVATWLVLGYFLFFPLDLWVLSRGLSEGAPNPPLYAALLSAIHLILFATLVRLYSARSNRDYAFLAVLAVASMLVSAILTVETSFLIALAVFLVLSVSTFVALEIRRSSAGAVSPPFEPGSPTARRLNRALGLTSVLVAAGVLAIGLVLFFLIPRFTTGYLSALNLQPGLLTGFSENVGARPDRRDQEEPRGGHAHPHRRRSRPRRGHALARHRAHQFRRAQLDHPCGRTSRDRAGSHRRIFPGRSLAFARRILHASLHRAHGTDRDGRDFRRSRIRQHSADVSARTSPAPTDRPVAAICCSIRPARSSIRRTTIPRSVTRAVRVCR